MWGRNLMRPKTLLILSILFILSKYLPSHPVRCTARAVIAAARAHAPSSRPISVQRCTSGRANRRNGMVLHPIPRLTSIVRSPSSPSE